MSSKHPSHQKFTNDQYKNYDKTRKQIYGADVGFHPTPEVKRAYDTYQTWRDDANASVNQYHHALGVVSKDKTFDIDDVGLLDREQHEQLVYPASKAASDTNMHASTRNAFLDDHPYGYSQERERKRHEHLADKATRQSDLYRRTYDTHLSVATAPKVAPAPAYGNVGSSVSPTVLNTSSGSSSSRPSNSGTYGSFGSRPLASGTIEPSNSWASAIDAYRSRIAYAETARTSVSRSYGTSSPMPSPEEAYGPNGPYGPGAPRRK